jgi:hypothetical protein
MPIVLDTVGSKNPAAMRSRSVAAVRFTRSWSPLVTIALETNAVVQGGSRRIPMRRLVHSQMPSIRKTNLLHLSF